MYWNGAVTGMMQVIIIATQVKIRKDQVPVITAFSAAVLGAVMIFVVPLAAAMLVLASGTAVSGSVLPVPIKQIDKNKV